ncbi:MAG: methyltransferase domain-containing protein [Gammaproteobacteria bacterium]|nr:MAG: methyltransferase domain-containing protein [Gammaproteobacteria bacterium]
MALVWQKQTKHTRYEVRSAGRTFRLYTNGVFHTQYNPTHAATGYVWDLLMLPALFFQPQTIQRVLVLGVGGGAAIHMLDKHVKPAEIVGVELDKVHLQIARRFFKLNKSNVRLYQADAVSWLKTYQGEKFDLIIDDLFMEKNGEPAAVVEADKAWFDVLLKHLSRQGVIVRNFISRQELVNSAPLINKALCRKFSSIFQFHGVQDENYVAAYFRSKVSAAQLKQQLADIPGLNPLAASCRLRFSLRRLK